MLKEMMRKNTLGVTRYMQLYFNKRIPQGKRITCVTVSVTRYMGSHTPSSEDMKMTARNTVEEDGGWKQDSGRFPGEKWNWTSSRGDMIRAAERKSVFDHPSGRLQELSLIHI